MALRVKRIVTGRLKENCYLAHDGRDAVIIDPGGRAPAILSYVRRKKLKVHGILNTHAHYDHVEAVEEVKVSLKVLFYLHSKESRLLNNINLFRRVFDGRVPIPIPVVDKYLDKIRKPLRFGALSIRSIFTPGHSPGGVSFLIGDCLFTGDALFKGAVGRVDLPGGSRTTLGLSLRTLGELPPSTKIYPGHYESSTIAAELKSNPKFKELIHESVHKRDRVLPS